MSFEAFLSSVVSLDLRTFDGIVFLKHGKIPGSYPRIHFAFINDNLSLHNCNLEDVVASGIVKTDHGMIRWERYVGDGLATGLAERDDAMPTLCPAPEPLSLLEGKPVLIKNLGGSFRFGVIHEHAKVINPEILFNITAVGLLTCHTFLS